MSGLVLESELELGFRVMNINDSGSFRSLST